MSDVIELFNKGGEQIRSSTTMIDEYRSLFEGKRPKWNELFESHAADAPKMSKLVLESSARMQALIDNLLDLARGRLTGGLPLTRDAAPLEPVLREVIDELRASQPDRSVETVISLNRPVDCDRARIAQLFSNLLGNALTYGSADEPIRVLAVCDKGTFQLSVANAGEPIPPAALDHLFHPFIAARRTRIERGSASGFTLPTR